MHGLNCAAGHSLIHAAMDTALTLTTTYLRQEYTCSLVQMLQRLTLPFAQRLRVDELLYDLYLGLVSIREREEEDGLVVKQRSTGP